MNIVSIGWAIVSGPMEWKAFLLEYAETVLVALATDVMVLANFIVIEFALLCSAEGACN